MNSVGLISQKPNLLQHKQAQQPARYEIHYSKEQITLLFSYLNTNSYYQNLKKQYKYIHWMSTDHKKHLLNLSHAILVKSDLKDNILKTYNNLSTQFLSSHINIVVIVIYGKVTTLNKSSQAGQFIQLQFQQPIINNLNQQKSVCLIFQKYIFEKEIQRLNQFHYKKQHLKLYFFDKLGIQLPSKKIDQINEDVQLHQEIHINRLLNSMSSQIDQGIYILIKGVYEVLPLHQKCLIAQISQTYFGEQTFWGEHQYRLKVKEDQSSYLYMKKQTLQRHLTQQKISQVIKILKSFYCSRKQYRSKTIVSVKNAYKNMSQPKQKVRKINKSQKDIDFNLLSVKSMKPQYQIDKQQKLALQKKPKSYLMALKQKNQTKHKYFSLRASKTKSQTEENDIFQKQIVKKHFSQQKRKSPLSIKGRSLTKLSVNSERDYSRFAKTGFFSKKEDHLMSYSTPKRSNSQPEFKRSNTQNLSDRLIKWDLQYSKMYDRQLSDSMKKQKHLHLLTNLKNKNFPKYKNQFFNLQDAVQSLQLSFYQLQKRRRQETLQKNKRSFQKIFKAKMLQTYSYAKVPYLIKQLQQSRK